MISLDHMDSAGATFAPRSGVGARAGLRALRRRERRRGSSAPRARPISRRLADACPQCAGPSPGGAVCGACLTHPPHFDATIAAWRYEFPVDRLVLALKFGRRLALADAFGDGARRTSSAERRVDALVPMPLGRARLAERGFNQALEIARHVARSTGLELAPELARRVRDTAPQTDLPHDERAANVRGAFECAGVGRRPRRWRWSTTS